MEERERNGEAEETGGRESTLSCGKRCRSSRAISGTASRWRYDPRKRGRPPAATAPPPPALFFPHSKHPFLLLKNEATRELQKSLNFQTKLINKHFMVNVACDYLILIWKRPLSFFCILVTAGIGLPPFAPSQLHTHAFIYIWCTCVLNHC